jgi:hypothetical protein
VNTVKYPTQLDGQYDNDTSRWLWLFKWLLVLPHVIVLMFLWFAALVLSIAAGITILFTCAYSKTIFDFNVDYPQQDRCGLVLVNRHSARRYRCGSRTSRNCRDHLALARVAPAISTDGCNHAP